jgi:hypothetical protein
MVNVRAYVVAMSSATLVPCLLPQTHLSATSASLSSGEKTYQIWISLFCIKAPPPFFS